MLRAKTRIFLLSAKIIKNINETTQSDLTVNFENFILHLYEKQFTYVFEKNGPLNFLKPRETHADLKVDKMVTKYNDPEPLIKKKIQKSK